MTPQFISAIPAALLIIFSWILAQLLFWFANRQVIKMEPKNIYWSIYFNMILIIRILNALILSSAVVVFGISLVTLSVHRAESNFNAPVARHIRDQIEQILDFSLVMSPTIFVTILVIIIYGILVVNSRPGRRWRTNFIASAALSSGGEARFLDPYKKLWSRSQPLTVRVASLMICVSCLLGGGLLSLNQIGPGLKETLYAAELHIDSEKGLKELANAIEQFKTEGPRSNFGTALVSNEEAVLVLRSAYLSALTNAFRKCLTQKNGLALARLSNRQWFKLQSIEAKQRVLAASIRTAPPSLEDRHSHYSYELSHPVLFAPRNDKLATILDQAIEGPIGILQKDEGVWTRVRAAASSAKPRLLGEAFFHTDFVKSGLPDLNAFRLWVNRAGYEFTSKLARGGELAASDEFISPDWCGNSMLTFWDRSAVGDFNSRVWSWLGSFLEDVSTGQLETASLHLLVEPSETARERDYYSWMFPSGVVFVEPGEPLTRIRSWSRIREIGRAGGPPSLANRDDGARSPSVAMTSARSYSRLQSSGRVGGVVIGREPDAVGRTELDVVDFTWTRDSKGYLVFTLKNASGKSVTLDPVHPAVVHHAMAYAADGRVIVSTLPLPTTLQDELIQIPARRVVVHPAFEDTAFACPAIQVDRFVDTFLYSEKQSATDSIVRVRQARTAVTQLGVLLKHTADLSRLDQLSESEQDWKALETGEAIEKALSDIAVWAKSCGSDDRCFPIKSYEGVLKLQGTDEYLKCLVTAAVGTACIGDLRKLNPEGAYLVDSGVREVAYTLDNDFDFLIGRNAKDKSWPLDFIIQAVPQTARGQDVNLGDGTDPWVFPAIEREIREMVAEGIASNADAKAVFSAMRQFVIMQRLFRLAFNGDLGTNFPLGVLVSLQQQTKSTVQIERNERWNVNGEWMRYVYSLQKIFLARFNEIVDDARASEPCKAAAREALNAHGRTPWPKGPGLWPVMARIDASCLDSGEKSVLSRVRREMRELELIEEATSVGQQNDSKVFTCKQQFD